MAYRALLRKSKLFLLALLLLSGSVYAGDTTRSSIKQQTAWKTLGSDIVTGVNDWGGYLSYPFHMSGRDWLIGTGAIGSTALLTFADKEITKKVSRGGNTDYRNDFWDVPTAYGYILYPAAGAGVMYLTGLFTRSDNIRVTARMILQSLAYSGTLDLGLKVLFGRERPYVSGDPNQFKAFQTNEDRWSLPSGHTTVAFAVSTVLAERINTWWSRVLFYSIASMTAYARVHNNMHWASDVFFGGLLGFSSGWFVVNAQKEREPKFPQKSEKTGSGFRLSPAFNGVSLSYNF
jgi:membrane-associated phospholipid phosphatase